MTPKNQIHPPELVPQILLPSVGADTPVRPPYRRSSIRRGGVLPRPITDEFPLPLRRGRCLHRPALPNLLRYFVGRAALIPPPFNPPHSMQKTLSLRDQHTRGSRNPHPPSTKNPAPPGRIFLRLSKTPPGFSTVLVTSSALPRPCAGRPHFPPWWPNWRRSG